MPTGNRTTCKLYCTNLLIKILHSAKASQKHAPTDSITKLRIRKIRKGCSFIISKGFRGQCVTILSSWLLVRTQFLIWQLFPKSTARYVLAQYSLFFQHSIVVISLNFHQSKQKTSYPPEQALPICTLTSLLHFPARQHEYEQLCVWNK